jgi:hypothetical protein
MRTVALPCDTWDTNRQEPPVPDAPPQAASVAAKARRATAALPAVRMSAALPEAAPPLSSPFVTIDRAFRENPKGAFLST